MPGTEAETYEKALKLHRSGDLQSAVSFYREVLDSNPEHFDAQYLLGTALLQTGEFDEAIAIFQRLIEHRKDVPDVFNNLGIALQAKEDWEQSAKAFQKAIELNPEYDSAIYNLGKVMETRGLSSDAEKCFRRTVELKPEDVSTRFSWANSLNALSRYDEAETQFRTVIENEPQNSNAKINLGFALVKQGKLSEAENIYREVLDENPDYAEIHNNLSYLQEKQGKLDEAIRSAEHAIALQADYADAWNNLGIALREMHDFEKACDAFSKATSLKENFHLAEFNLGTTKLLMGNWLEGWKGYGLLNKLDGQQHEFQHFPRWNGETMPGLRLLVHADQGFGDTIQFSRFLPKVKEISQAEVVFAVQPELQDLLENCVSLNSKIEKIDRQIALSELPGLFQLSLDNLSTKIPGILKIPGIWESFTVSEKLNDAFESLPDGRPRIGIVWKGNPRQPRDYVRSCPWEKFATLIENSRFTFLSLQVDSVGNSEIQETNCIDLGPHLQNFTDTAWILERIDLLITVDTAIAHLAGAMGRPVWTLLCHTPDWRWLLEREDSPWYPTMKLFRQPKRNDWETVLENVKQALSKL